jgi:hypothetical protein
MSQLSLRSIPNLGNSKVEINGNKVKIESLEIENADLATHLGMFEGPEQIIELVDIMNLAVKIKKLSVVTADVQELDSVGKQVKKTMEEAGEQAFEDIKKFIGDQTDTTQQTSLISLLKTRLIDQVVRELDPTKESSPFHILNEQLIALLEKGSAEEAAAAATAAAFGNSREKGIDFETLLDMMIQKESAVHNDDAQFTGETPSPSGDKTGDEVVIINPALTSGEEIRIVWEAKTDKSYKATNGRLKRDKISVELEKAINNREAICGIFVSDSRDIDLELQPIWQEFEGNKLAIVIDHDEPDQRLIRMAYLWARGYALRSLESDTTGVDFEAVERILAAIRRESDGIATLKRYHTPIRENIKNAEDWLKEFENSLDGLLDELTDVLNNSEEDEE